MKRFKQVLSGILCAGMLFTMAACGKSGGGADDDALTFGRYVETEISPPDMKGSPSNLSCFEGGVIDLITTEYDDSDFSMPTYFHYRSTDNGAKWEELDMSWAAEYATDMTGYGKDNMPEEMQAVGQLFPLASGEVIASVNYYNTVNGDNKTTYLRVAKDGQIAEFSLPIIDEMADGGKRIVNSYMTPISGNIVFMEVYSQPKQENPTGGMAFSTDDYKQVRTVVDLETGKQIFTMPEDFWSEYYYNDKYMFYADPNNNEKFIAISLADGSKQDIKTPSPQQLGQYGFGGFYNTFVDSENNFFTINNRGIEKISPDAEEPEQVMDGINYSYGSPLAYVQQMRITSEGAIILSLSMQDEDGKLMSYKYDEKAVATSKKTVSVYSLYDSPTVRLALSEYKRLHPEVMVSYETPLSQNDGGNGPMPLMMEQGGGASSTAGEGLTEEDALRALNAAILAGDGPDVIILDNLPLESYIDQGILEDISGLLEGADVFENITAPFIKDGKMYAVPTRFSMPLLFGARGDVEKYNTFDGLVEGIVAGPGKPAVAEIDWENATEEEMNNYWRNQQMPTPKEERPILLFNDMGDLSNVFYEMSAPAIFSQKEGINREALTKYLDAVKKVADKYGLLEDVENGGMGGVSYAASFGSSLSGALGYMSNSNTVYEFTSQKSLLGYNQFFGFNTLNNISSNIFYSSMGFASGYDMFGNPLDEDGNKIERTKIDVNAINAPGLAEGAFYPGITVGISTAAKRPELAKDFVSVMLSENVQKYDLNEGLPVTISGFKIQEEKYNKLQSWEKLQGLEKINFDYEALIKNVNSPFFSNKYLHDVIMQAVDDYCFAGASLDDAVNKVISETELYFAERQ